MIKNMKQLIVIVVLLSILPCGYAYSMGHVTMPWSQLLILTGDNNALRSYLAARGNPNVISSHAKYSLLGLIANQQHKADMLKLLLDYGADVNYQDVDGNTALYDAIFSGSPEMVRMLVGAGASMTVENNAGVTPVQYLATVAKMSQQDSRLSMIKNFFISLDPENATILRDNSSVRERRAQQYPRAQASLVNENIPVAQAYYSRDEDK